MADGETHELRNLEDVIDRIESRTEGRERVAVTDVLEAFADRLYGPLLVVPGLLIVSPLGALPGAPIVLAVMVVLIAGQQAWGRSWPWMPGWIASRWVGRGRLVSALESSRGLARAIDKVIKPRWGVLLRPPMPRVVAAICAGLGALFVPLGLIPFGVTGPGLAIVAFGLALIARDGVVAGLGLVITAASVGGAVWMWV